MHRLRTLSPLVALLLAAPYFAGCRGGDAPYKREVEKSRAERLARLTSETGWLTLSGLFWLKEGENRFGADSADAIVLPRSVPPGSSGSFWCESGTVRLVASTGARIFCGDKLVKELLMASDQAGTPGAPTVLSMGSVRLQIIERGGRLGVRVKDSQNEARTHFQGLTYFPVDEKWRIQAAFLPYHPPKTIPISTVINTLEQDSCPGACVFSFGGKECHLDAVAEPGSGELLIMFSDETSGKETYPGGRQLAAPLPDTAGNVVLDFNKALNWPCAFTEFATCPIPPPQNHLPFRVEAGEKKYSSAPHEARPQ
jgi:uncharacterized protein (DUF1684 family)